MPCAPRRKRASARRHASTALPAARKAPRCLMPASICWSPAQAFHWFDVPAARCEALRIVRPGAFGALLWNERPARVDAFLVDYEALLLKHAAEYATISASRADERGMREFFGGTMQFCTFPNQQHLDFVGLKGRLMSSSYAPEEGHPQHEPMIAGLTEVFAAMRGTARSCCVTARWCTSRSCGRAAEDAERVTAPLRAPRSPHRHALRRRQIELLAGLAPRTPRTRRRDCARCRRDTRPARDRR